MPESKRKQSNENPSVQQQTFTLQQSLKVAMQHHGAGELPKAEGLYRQILHSDPNQPVALHLLGVLAHQTGKHEMAVELITKAIGIKPDYAEAHSNLGNVLKELGRLDDAVAHYHKAIELKPEFFGAHNNLGFALQELGRLDDAVLHYHKAISIKSDFAEAHSNLGNALKELGRLDDAVIHYHKAVGIKPDYGDAYYNLGTVLQMLGRLDDAVTHYRKAIDIRPDYAGAHYNLGTALQALGQLDDAVAHYYKAIEIKPDYVEAHSNLGNTFQELGHLEDAVTHFRKAIEIKPDYAEAHSNLGNILQEFGRLEEAVVHYHRAIELKPEYAEAYSSLGNTLLALRRADEAVIHYRKAIDIKPDFAEFYTSLGNAAQFLGHLSDAVVHHRKAIKLKPDCAEAHNNLGIVLQDLGRLDEALVHYRKAIDMKPDFAVAHSNLAGTLHDLGRVDDAFRSYRRAFDIKPDFNSAHSNLIFNQDFCQSIDLASQQAERKCWDLSFGVVAEGIPSHTNNKDPERRLRIGYVSADFRIHSAAQGFGPLILEHDREHFEVVCYSGNHVNDAYTETFKAAASLWRSIVGLSDERLAELIRDDGIDILVDLSGHSSGNRLPVFAHKPAPIQMSGVGHLPPGLSAIDYRLTSEEITKRSEEALFPEQPIYLRTYMAYRPPVDLPPLGAAPCLETGVVTFGCFNRFVKVSHEAIELWASILVGVPGARLVLKDKRFANETEREAVCDLFGTFGVTSERLMFFPLTSFQEHLATYNQIDITLDPFPHGGGISTLESLLMGVPVIGMGGGFKLSSRITRMMCVPVGLNEWLADSAQSYKTIAIEAAQNPERLSALRSTLRQRVEDVYLLFTGDVERAYRLAWKGWCEGSPPKPLDMTT